MNSLTYKQFNEWNKNNYLLVPNSFHGGEIDYTAFNLCNVHSVVWVGP